MISASYVRSKKCRRIRQKYSKLKSKSKKIKVISKNSQTRLVRVDQPKAMLVRQVATIQITNQMLQTKPLTTRTRS